MITKGQLKGQLFISSNNITVMGAKVFSTGAAGIQINGGGTGHILGFNRIGGTITVRR